MAIKGKSKSRGGRRVVAAPPRPTLVVRKPPIWRRRWPWATLGAVVAAAVVSLVLVKLHDSRDRSFRAKEKAAVQSFSRALEKRLPPDRKIVPPDLENLFPNLSTDLSNLGSGKVADDAKAMAEAQRVSSSATRASRAIASMTPAKFFPPSFEVTGNRRLTGKGATVAAMQEAQFLISQSLRLYGQVGDLMRLAARASGNQRRTLVDQAQTLLANASTLFDRGFQKVLALRQAVGFRTINPASGVQPGQPLPTVAPSPNASASGSPSPSPSAASTSPPPSASP